MKFVVAALLMVLIPMSVHALTFGYTTVGGSATSIKNTLRFTKGTPASSGTIDNPSGYWFRLVNCGTNDHLFTMLLYNWTSDTDVGSKVYTSNESACSSGDTNIWYVTSPASASSVVGGTDYFVGIGGQNNLGVFSMAFDSGATTYANNVAITYPTFPDPPTSETTGTALYSQYIQYTASAAGGGAIYFPW